MTLTIRCSSTDRVMACASSLAPTDHPYNPETDEAREGDAAHEVLAAMVAGVDIDLDAVARRYRVDRDALFMLLHRGRQAWAQLQQYFPAALSEHAMRAEIAPGVTLSGHADVVDLDVELRPAVLDWKAGWRPSDHPYQLMSYALLVLLLTGADEVLAVEVWLRLGKLEVHTWTRADLEAYRDELLAQVPRAGEQWGPGPDACQYCPLQLTCPAKADYDRGAVAGLMEIAGDRYPAGREMVARLWEKRCALRRALDRFDAIADAELADGPIDLGDGWQLERIVEERTKVKPSRSIAYLRDVVGLEDVECDRLITIGKGKLEEMVRTKAGSGRRGGAAWKKAQQDLEELGAFDSYIHTEKRAVKVGAERK